MSPWLLLSTVQMGAFQVSSHTFYQYNLNSLFLYPGLLILTVTIVTAGYVLNVVFHHWLCLFPTTVIVMMF